MDKVRIGDICTVVSGSTPKSNIEEYWNGDIKWITPAEITDDSYVISDTERHITEKAVEKTNLTLLPVGTVLLSSRAPIGKTAIVGAEMYCNQGFKNLICSERIYNKYLYFFLTSKVDYLNALGRGATFKEISKGIVEDVEILLPSLDEQKKIVERFEAIQQLISKRKQVLLHLDNLVKSRFVEMFGEILDNGIPLAQLAEITGGLTKNSKRNTFPNQMPYLRVANVLFNQLDLSEVLTIGVKDNEIEKTMLCKGDLLFVEGNGSVEQIGRVAVWDGSIEPCLHQNHLIKARFNSRKINPVYALFYFMSQKGRAQIVRRAVSTSGLHTLSVGKIESLELPVPPIEKQNQFADFVALTDKSKLAVQQSIETLQTLKAKLMQDYFG